LKADGKEEQDDDDILSDSEDEEGSNNGDGILEQNYNPIEVNDDPVVSYFNKHTFWRG
jgi:hypothetical protein